jgi:hypothetical protein
MTSRPFEEADDADLAEQQRSIVDDGDEPPTRTATPDEADEADALEQDAELADDDEEYEHGG